MGVDILSLSIRLALSANLDSHLFTVARCDRRHREHDPKKEGLSKGHDFVRVLCTDTLNRSVKL